MTRKVYVVSNGGHDYSDAERFGSIVFCTKNVIRKTDTAQMYRELSDAMQHSNPYDYLLVSSLTTLCTIAAGILSARHGELHLLLYEGGQYIERDIILEYD